jgi:hypothetical protein
MLQLQRDGREFDGAAPASLPGRDARTQPTGELQDRATDWQSGSGKGWLVASVQRAASGQQGLPGTGRLQDIAAQVFVLDEFA